MRQRNEKHQTTSWCRYYKTRSQTKYRQENMTRLCILIEILKLCREFSAMYVQNQDVYEISQWVQNPGRPNANCKVQVHLENWGEGNGV